MVTTLDRVIHEPARLLLVSRGKQLGSHPKALLMIPIEGGLERDVTPVIDRDIGAWEWLPDGRALLVRAPDVTRFRAWIQPVNGSPRQLAWGAIDPGALNVNAGGAVIITGREPNRPSELYYLASVDAVPRPSRARPCSVSRFMPGVDGSVG